jgi:hypothetical protein
LSHLVAARDEGKTLVYLAIAYFLRGRETAHLETLAAQLSGFSAAIKSKNYYGFRAIFQKSIFSLVFLRAIETAESCMDSPR